MVPLLVTLRLNKTVFGIFTDRVTDQVSPRSLLLTIIMYNYRLLRLQVEDNSYQQQSFYGFYSPRLKFKLNRLTLNDDNTTKDID